MFVGTCVVEAKFQSWSATIFEPASVMLFHDLLLRYASISTIVPGVL